MRRAAGPGREPVLGCAPGLAGTGDERLQTPAPVAQAESQKTAERPPEDPWRGLRVGVATYSLRALKVEDAIEAITRVDLKFASLKDAHLRLEAPQSWRKAVARKFKEAKITLASCGVINMENDDAKLKSYFDYAKDINVPVIVCSPSVDAYHAFGIGAVSVGVAARSDLRSR